jgi:PBP1b-binding outer membrane lipoprotein LpoB
MRFHFGLLLLLIGSLVITGCISEPAPSEPHSYGQITNNTKAKKQKAPKKQKEPETTTRVVGPFDERPEQ